jgi:spore germination cell wall hydrolase CwlJ-like protein
MKKIFIISVITSFLIGCIGGCISTIIENSKEETVIIKELEPIHIETNAVEIVEEQATIEEVASQEYIAKMEELKTTEDKKQWFIEYKDLIFKYYKYLDPPETVFDVFSEEEVQLIFRVVETETYDQDFISKANVASVVFNRFYSGEFGDTITEVITADKQFAYGRKCITEDTILAVMFSFEVEDTTDGALYFHSNEKTEEFCGAKYSFSDDAIHHFYK